MSAPIKIELSQIEELGRRIGEIIQVGDADPGNAIGNWFEAQGFDTAALAKAMGQLETAYATQLGYVGNGAAATRAFLAGWIARELFGPSGPEIPDEGPAS